MFFHIKTNIHTLRQPHLILLSRHVSLSSHITTYRY